MKKTNEINWVVGKEYLRADGQVVRCLATDCAQSNGVTPVVLMNVKTGEITIIDLTGGKKSAINLGVDALPFTIVGEAA